MKQCGVPQMPAPARRYSIAPRSANPSLAFMALPLVALANQVIGDQDFAAAAHGRNWPDPDLRQCPLHVRFLGVKRTRYAQSEIFRV
jgi:hypothetical protein